jgi:hypothetical protein
LRCFAGAIVGDGSDLRIFAIRQAETVAEVNEETAGCFAAARC